MNTKYFACIAFILSCIAVASTSLEAKTRINIGLGAIFDARTPYCYPRREIVGVRPYPIRPCPERVVVYQQPVYRQREVIVVRDNQPTYQPYIQDVIEDGRLIRLEDGSLWEVSYCDSQLTRRWLRYDTIEIKRPRNRATPFQLNNLTTGDKVGAELRSRS